MTRPVGPSITMSKPLTPDALHVLSSVLPACPCAIAAAIASGESSWAGAPAPVLQATNADIAATDNLTGFDHYCVFAGRHALPSPVTSFAQSSTDRAPGTTFRCCHTPRR